MLGLFGLFLGGGLSRRAGYLYQKPGGEDAAARMPARALVAGFVTFSGLDRSAGLDATTRSSASLRTPQRNSTSSKPCGGWGLAASSSSIRELRRNDREVQTQQGQKFYEEDRAVKATSSNSGLHRRPAPLPDRCDSCEGPDDAEPVRYNAVLEERDSQGRAAIHFYRHHRPPVRGSGRRSSASIFNRWGRCSFRYRYDCPATLLLNFGAGRGLDGGVSFWPILCGFSFLLRAAVLPPCSHL